MHIRPADASDYAAIDAVLEHAFDSKVEGGITRALRDADADTLELVAEKHDRIIGQIMFSPAHGERDGEAESYGLALGPLAVAPAEQGQGVGSALADAGLDFIATLGVPWCILLGEPAYYQRFGFELASHHGLSWEKDKTGELAAYFQIKQTSDKPLPGAGMRLHYHPAFDLAD